MKNNQMPIGVKTIFEYNQCKAFLNGEIGLGKMYPIMMIYWEEISFMLKDQNVNEIPDQKIAENFCRNVNLIS